MNKILEVNNLFSYYGGICALNDVSLYINEGEITSIIGSNGAGKSTLMRTIAGDKKIDKGSILFNGNQLPSSVNQVVSGGISLVPEGRRIFPSLSVKENLILGTCSRKDYKNAIIRRVVLFLAASSRCLQLDAHLWQSPKYCALMSLRLVWLL